MNPQHPNLLPAWTPQQSIAEDDTIQLGRRIAAGLPRQCTVLLIGDLGAGKTTLAKGILEGLGVASVDEVTSPTFTLIHEYRGAGAQDARRAFHIDLYRLDTPAEIASLGLDEIFDREAVVLIEWGERFPQLMPSRRLEIRIDASADDQRLITFDWRG